MNNEQLKAQGKGIVASQSDMCGTAVIDRVVAVLQDIPASPVYLSSQPILIPDFRRIKRIAERGSPYQGGHFINGLFGSCILKHS